MITGIILWWPKRKIDRKRSFIIKWGGRWRRVNYDLHNVLGFYVTIIVLILGITGVAISFNWVSNGLYAAGNLGEKYPAENRILTSDTIHQSYANNQPKMDLGFFVAMKRSPQAEMFLIYDDPAPQRTISITAYAKSLHYYNSDLYLFDKYSGKLLGVLPQRQKSPGRKLNEMNYDIHVGQIAGLPGKILAFLASLVCASLPITGLIIWLGKQKKN